MLALGFDARRGALYRQSDVPEICELAQLLAAVTPKGLLNRAHAYKAAVDDNRRLGRDDDHSVNMGLYSYPLLMAADILAVSGDRVPVGQDQKQHLEIARDVAQAFNQRYGEVLTVPAAVIDEAARTVPGTDGRKMSKSHGNVIPILGSPEDITRAVMGIVTDSRGLDEPKDPDTDITFQLFDLLADEAGVHALRERYLAPGMGYAEAKRQLADLVISTFIDARRCFDALMADPCQVEAALEAGAARVRALAAPLLRDVKHAMGLGPAALTAS